MKNLPREIFIVYEYGHLDKVKERIKDDGTTICLDFLLERECAKRQIPFIPLRNLVDAETGEEKWWELSHEISREWYRLPAMEFFQHRGIRIAEAPEPIMQAHLARLFYYVRIFLVLKKAYPDASFFIPDPIEKNTDRTECLAAFRPWAVLEAGRMVGLVKDDKSSHIIKKTYKFESITLKNRFLNLFNFLMSLMPRKGMKIYMSGYWPHAESLLPLMDNTEVMLLESRKFTKIPWWQILKHRMRAMYSHGPISTREEKEAREVCENFVEKWENAKEQVASYLQSIHKDLNWNPVLEACEHFITYSPRVVADINTLYRIMSKEKPDLILQMASVGGPHHYFFLMARVASLLKIPSIELQHATVTIDPRSVFCRIETDYLLTYGDHINEWHEKIGNDPKKLISVGSPRFDKYVNERQEGEKQGKQLFKELGLDLDRPVLLVAVPFYETYASAVDSYRLAEFFEVINSVQKKTPGLQVVFKCRNPRFVGVTKEYLKGLFSADWAVAGVEDIFPLICASDAVICNNSTIIYQAVLARRPLVLHPWKKFDSYHAQLYSSWIPLLYTAEETANTLIRLFSQDPYRQELLSKQDQFLKGYLFDGKSSERVARLIKKLAENNK